MSKPNSSSRVGQPAPVKVKPTRQRVMLLSGPNLKKSFIWRDI